MCGSRKLTLKFLLVLHCLALVTLVTAHFNKHKFQTAIMMQQQQQPNNVIKQWNNYNNNNAINEKGNLYNLLLQKLAIKTIPMVKQQQQQVEEEEEEKVPSTSWKSYNDDQDNMYKTIYQGHDENTNYNNHEQYLSHFNGHKNEQHGDLNYNQIEYAKIKQHLNELNNESSEEQDQEYYEDEDEFLKDQQLDYKLDGEDSEMNRENIFRALQDTNKSFRLQLFHFNEPTNAYNNHNNNNKNNNNKTIQANNNHDENNYKETNKWHKNNTREIINKNTNNNNNRYKRSYIYQHNYNNHNNILNDNDSNNELYLQKIKPADINSFDYDDYDDNYYAHDVDADNGKLLSASLLYAAQNKMPHFMSRSNNKNKQNGKNIDNHYNTDNYITRIVSDDDDKDNNEVDRRHDDDNDDDDGKSDNVLIDADMQFAHHADDYNHDVQDGDEDSNMLYGIQNAQKRKKRSHNTITYQSLCPTKRSVIPLETELYEYRPQNYVEIKCEHHMHSYSPNEADKNRICSEAGFECIQLNRTIQLIRRQKYSTAECWESEMRIVPSGCECMWPKHNYGNIWKYHNKPTTATTNSRRRRSNVLNNQHNLPQAMHATRNEITPTETVTSATSIDIAAATVSTDSADWHTSSSPTPQLMT